MYLDTSEVQYLESVFKISFWLGIYISI